MRSAFIHRAASGVVIAACCTIATAAIAGGIAGGEGMILRWTCVQQHDKSFNVRCIPRMDVAFPGAFPLRSAALFWEDILGHPPAASRAVSVGLSAPDTRPVAMRHSDEIFSGEAWYVPLHNQPADTTNVFRVLQSVLCGTTSYCRISYGAGGSRSSPEE